MTLNLSSTQKQIVEFGDGALLVVAGPGSGKTRVLTERIRRLLSSGDPNLRVLALTFTNKAANEMRERLAEFPDIHDRAFIGTMHSFCLEVLRSRGQAVGITSDPHIFESYADRKEVLRQAVMAEPNLRELLFQQGGTKEADRLLGRWLEMISSAKSKLLVSSALDNDTDRQVYDCYDQGLRASNAYDFDDLLLLAYRLFTERPKIADFYRRQYRFIFIDESQDINEAQYRLLQALCGETYRNVMMVGDPKQAIFMWNGASPQYLDMFAQDFSAKRIELTENYRCSQEVVRLAKLLVGQYSVQGKIPIKGESGLFEADDEEAEAGQIVQKISTLLSKGHPDIEGPATTDRIAILGRNRYVFAALENAFTNAGIPYYKKVSTQTESESDLLKEFELCLRLAANPNDRLHFGTLAQRWGITAADVPWNDSAALMSVLAASTSPAHQTVIKAVRLLMQQEKPNLIQALEVLNKHAENEGDQARELIYKDIEAWKSHWDGYLRSPQGSSRNLVTFLSQMALGTTQQPRQEGVALLTIHSAKGLEFDVVFTMGMAEGTFPDYRARGASMQEEIRNAFVAITRSKRLVYFSYPKVKDLPWGQRPQAPSQFLKKLGFVS